MEKNIQQPTKQEEAKEQPIESKQPQKVKSAAKKEERKQHELELTESE